MDKTIVDLQVYRLFRQMRVPVTITKKSISMISNYTEDVCAQLIARALSFTVDRSTLTHADVDAACALVLPRDLRQESREFGRLRLASFRREQRRGNPGSRSISDRAGLVFSVYRMHTQLKRTWLPCQYRLEKNASILLTAVLEYVTQEVLTACVAAAIGRGRDRNRILPRHVRMAVSQDDDLRRLVKNARAVLEFNYATARANRVHRHDHDSDDDDEEESDGEDSDGEDSERRHGEVNVNVNVRVYVRVTLGSRLQ